MNRIADGFQKLSNAIDTNEYRDSLLTNVYRSCIQLLKLMMMKLNTASVIWPHLIWQSHSLL
ncbi:hypothetical protein AXF42_Ash006598 [Apostasia shenzhenica]|uniref:Uncharacterized protein n=1 Tax=Apostasia shenzhenica TaxID=1088818 RepID=A0A2I0AIU6_9ASPA|nr:hypothetical protein AXF42_Ash006598 [Apostasia shenzhenica]